MGKSKQLHKGTMKINLAYQRQRRIDATAGAVADAMSGRAGVSGVPRSASCAYVRTRPRGAEGSAARRRGHGGAARVAR